MATRSRHVPLSRASQILYDFVHSPYERIVAIKSNPRRAVFPDLTDMQSNSSSSQQTCLLQKRTAFACRRTASRSRCSCLAAQTNTGWKPKVSTPQSIAATTCALALSYLCAEGACAAEPAEVFQRSGCIGCHAGGGNIVQAGASLQTSDLQKNGAATTDAIYKLVYYGKGKMPGYGKECTPRGKCTFGPRLPDEDVQRLSQYVLDQAAVKWK